MAGKGNYFCPWCVGGVQILDGASLRRPFDEKQKATHEASMHGWQWRRSLVVRGGAIGALVFYALFASEHPAGKVRT